MASKPRDLVVRFMSDVTGFLRGTDQVSDAYREIADDADTAGAAGDQSADKLARAYRDAADDVDRSARDMSDSYKRVGRDVDTETTGIRTRTREGFRETGREAGAELAQNLGQGFESGDPVGAITGTVGGLAATLGTTGPIGLALAGVATAASVAWAAISSGAQAAAQKTQDAFDEIVNQTTKAERFSNVLTDAFGSYTEGLSAIVKYADESGIAIDQIRDALAEGGVKGDQLIKRIDDAIQRERIRLTMSGLNPYDDQIKDLTTLRDLQNDRNDAVRRGNDLAQVQNGLNADDLEAQRDIRREMERQAQLRAERGPTDYGSRAGQARLTNAFTSRRRTGQPAANTGR